jgi:transcriptional regulator with XRE-family HTH domain
MVLKDNYTEKQLHNLSERFKKLRKEKGFSNYEHFAYENDLSRSQYGRYENGEDLRFSSLLKVLKAMDISLKDFFSEGFE